MKNLYKFPSLCIWLSLLIISLGIFYLSNINISLYPDTSKPIVYISANPKGIAPLAFKKKYGDQIESSLRAIEDAEEVKGAIMAVTIPIGELHFLGIIKAAKQFQKLKALPQL